VSGHRETDVGEPLLRAVADYVRTTYGDVEISQEQWELLYWGVVDAIAKVMEPDEEPP
jgi:hypothetical protein